MIYWFTLSCFVLCPYSPYNPWLLRFHKSEFFVWLLAWLQYTRYPDSEHSVLQYREICETPHIQPVCYYCITVCTFIYDCNIQCIKAFRPWAFRSGLMRNTDMCVKLSLVTKALLQHNTTETKLEGVYGFCPLQPSICTSALTLWGVWTIIPLEAFPT